jgi:signal transduction histidine kinase
MAIRLKAWVLPAAAFVVTSVTLITGLAIVDRVGEAAIANQQAANAVSARNYFLNFAREEGVPALANALNRHERQGPDNGFRYALLDANGNTTAGAHIVGDLDNPDEGWETLPEPNSKRLWRVLATPLGQDQTLVVAEDLATRDGFHQALIRAAAVALVLMAAAMTAVGAIFNSLLFRRARDIAHTAERIAGGDLSARTPVHPDGDVFDHLGQSLNAMLTNMEGLMIGLRTVTDSLTHDLRTPLTHMKGALARAQDSHADPRDREEALAQASEEAERMLSTLTALTDIAHAETGLSRDMMQPMDVSAMVAEMGELFAPVIEDAEQTLEVETPARPVVMPVFEALLRQAVGNMLHNAAVHAGVGAKVTLALTQSSHRIALSVCDTGAGIPDEHLGRVQERFVRLDESRGKPGSGLGLAIAAACAKLHGGRLILRDNHPGLAATLEIPLHPGG